jgi:Ca-activated chloride channel family protein
MEIVVAQNAPHSRQRHRAPRAPWSGKRLISPVAAGVAILVLVTGAGMLAGNGLTSIFRANASGQDCVDPTTIRIIADESIAPALTSIAADFDLQQEHCVNTEIKAQRSGDTSALLASNAAGTADAWIPDSPVWVTRMNATAAALGRQAPDVRVGGSMATTPVIFAAPASRASEFAAQPIGWNTLLSGGIGALFPDPEVASASLAGLASLTRHASGIDERQLPATMIELGKTIPESSIAAFDTALSAPVPTVVVTTEQEVVAHNLSDPVIPLVAIYPADGTTALGYPFVRLAVTEGDDDASKQKLELLESFAKAARSADTVFSAEGFRNSSGGGQIAASGVLERPTAAVPAVDGAAQIAALDQWSVLTRRSRILVAVDVSGSMLEPVGGGLTRMDVFQRAAGTALGRFGGEVDMGLWVFSTERAGGQDWEELAPVAPLANEAHRISLGTAVATLQQYIRGDTGLYDTILAGVTTMRDNYDSRKVNSLLIISDGKNDDRVTIDLETLLAKLTEMSDPLKPVPVILIGFGPDSDFASMQQIAKTTGGAAYAANEPSDLGKVFVDAFTQRTCRPNC